ncbi:MAG: recombinase family protein [Myxococcales bacterium]|nr:recombinase family protein [Myxococcales bacterium]
MSYLRVSTPGQAERELSLPAQRAAITDFAARRSATIVREYADAGASGTDPRRREVRRMLEDIYAPGSDIKTIVVRPHVALHPRHRRGARGEEQTRQDRRQRRVGLPGPARRPDAADLRARVRAAHAVSVQRVAEIWRSLLLHDPLVKRTYARLSSIASTSRPR